MFEDYNVGEFNKVWNETIQKFGLGDNEWVQGLYERRKMWARGGNFFVGFRTTSRREALNA
jgi:hypothetical protein